MTVLADYTPEEQRLLLVSLRAAGVAVSAASLGKSAETASEGFAAASYVLESEGEYLDNTLIQSVQFDLKRRSEAGQQFASYQDAAEAAGAKQEALETLRQVVALLDAKSPGHEAAQYRQWLMNIAQRVAAAGKEGGNWLGWGAVEINDAERAALQEIGQVLGV